MKQFQRAYCLLGISHASRAWHSRLSAAAFELNQIPVYTNIYLIYLPEDKCNGFSFYNDEFHSIALTAAAHSHLLFGGEIGHSQSDSQRHPSGDRTQLHHRPAQDQIRWGQLVQFLRDLAIIYHCMAETLPIPKRICQWKAVNESSDC